MPTNAGITGWWVATRLCRSGCVCEPDFNAAQVPGTSRHRCAKWGARSFDRPGKRSWNQMKPSLTVRPRWKATSSDEASTLCTCRVA